MSTTPDLDDLVNFEGRPHTRAYAVAALRAGGLTRAWAVGQANLLSIWDGEALFAFDHARHPRDARGRFLRVGAGTADDPIDLGKLKTELVTPAVPAMPTLGECTLCKEATVEPIATRPYRPDPRRDRNKDGVADAARVGVPGMQVPPPPNYIPRLPNLTPQERAAESRFARTYEADPDGVAAAYRAKLAAREIGDGPNIFNTDDAKLLSGDYNPQGVSKDEVFDARSRLNVAVHGTANAIAKRAFVSRLDEIAKLPTDQRTVLVTSGGVACHGIDTPILMSDGTVKMVQAVRTGDAVMGPDSKPRVVLRTHRGVGDLYRVTPKRGAPFTVNGEHVLALWTMRGTDRKHPTTMTITVNEILARGSRFRKNSYLYRSAVGFPATPVPLDPYFLGLWLGDGIHTIPSITSADCEIAAYLAEFAKQFSRVKLVVHAKKNNRASQYQLSFEDAARANPNPITKILRELNVLRNKHVPRQYLINSREVRLQLLAGLLDSDGHLYNRAGGGTFEFVTKFPGMAQEVEFLARSLGFAAHAKSRQVTCRFGDYEHTGTYYRMNIGGDVCHIPTKIKRKQALPRSAKVNGDASKNPLRTGYTIEPVGQGSYFGFTTDGDGLYLLGDFTVTHNSGKGYAIGQVSDVANVASKVGAVWDAAGEQNGTENPWVLQECRKRGIHATFVYVHADPTQTWENPQRGVIERAQGKGRMVDARVFADSYAYGAKNFKAFAETNAGASDASFVYLKNVGKPEQMPAMPAEALAVDSEALYDRSARYLAAIAGRLKPGVIRGGSIGRRIWGDPKPRGRAAR